LLNDVRQVDGVKEAFGFLVRRAQIIGRDGNAIISGGAPTLGLLYNPNADMTSFRLRSGVAPQGPDQAVIDVHTASTQGWKVGDKVAVVLPQGGPHTSTISGTTGFGDQDNLAGATVVALDPQAGPALLSADPEYDGVDLKAQNGISADTLKA